MRAAEFADKALCSVETARAGGLEGCWAERFSDRDEPIWAYHPAFVLENGEDDQPDHLARRARDLAPLFLANGWPRTTERAIEVILSQLAASYTRASAYEALRRSRSIPALLRLPRASWNALLRMLLGNPVDPNDVTARGKGILLRLELDETLADLEAEKDLWAEILGGAPAPESQPEIPIEHPQEVAA